MSTSDNYFQSESNLTPLHTFSNPKMEENSDGVTEGLNEWEQIQSPSHHPSSSTTATHPIEHDDGPTVACIDDYIPNNYSVFHPSNHEGLPIVSPPQDNPHAQETPSFSSDSNSDEGDEVGSIGSRLGVLRSWVVRVGYAVRSCGGCGGGFWSFVCATGVLALAVVYVKVMRWRRRVFQRESEERLMLLLREKDKQINQLLLQIAQMNGILSAQRTVPVIRFGPLVVS